MFASCVRGIYIVRIVVFLLRRVWYIVRVHRPVYLYLRCASSDGRLPSELRLAFRVFPMLGASV